MRARNRVVEEKPYTFSEKIRMSWFAIDALTHLTIELGYVWLALTTTAAKTDTYMGWIWREYARADARWAVRDPTVISIEIATVCLGVLCLAQLAAIYYRKGVAHPLQMCICVAELYGGWMTFAPQWLDGSPDLNGSDFYLLYIYLWFMNGLWVVVPAVLLWESFSVTSHAMAGVAPENPGVSNMPGPAVWVGIVGFLVLYNVLVPAVLFSATGVPVSQ